MIPLGVFLCPNWTIRRSYGPSWEHCQWISIKWTGTGQLVVTHRCARGNRSCSQTVTRSAHCVDESLRRVNIDLSAQVAAALFHDSVYGGETQPCSFVAVLGREERFENLRLRFRVHPCPCIRDGQHYILAWDRTRMFPRKSRIEFSVCRLDCQFAPIRDGVPGVAGQIP